MRAKFEGFVFWAAIAAYFAFVVWAATCDHRVPTRDDLLRARADESAMFLRMKAMFGGAE